MVFVFFCMPEFKGRSIESTDDLFQNSIWTMYKRAYPPAEPVAEYNDRMVLYSMRFDLQTCIPFAGERQVELKKT